MLAIQDLAISLISEAIPIYVNCIMLSNSLTMLYVLCVFGIVSSTDFYYYKSLDTPQDITSLCHLRHFPQMLAVFIRYAW